MNSYVHTNYHGQFMDDSNNISTRQANQQNKESINAICDKIDEANVEIDTQRFRDIETQILRDIET